ncbi:MAG: DUF4037 domain-containing protein [Ruminococcaceae bacterium]|nr:DUF4037 domain-containing protein [Oscillospiraceae bacterium]
MRGLELAKAYFYEEGLPRLRREVPGAMPFLAAGLVGEGSDCFGYDDFISRDHDWGPGFCLWLPERMMASYAEGIRAVLDSLPDEFEGFYTRKLNGNPRLGLHSIEEFYSSLTLCTKLPQNADKWLALPESGLAAAINGEVFLDNAGEFSAIRSSLAKHYPEDVRLWRLARRCALAAQTGQYNYLRCLRHGESAAAEMIKGRFAENAAGALFLLNKRYMPFYKWSFRALRQLPLMGREAAEYIDIIMESRGMDAIESIEALSGLIISLLCQQGLSSGESSFLMDHCGEIIQKIEDSCIRNKIISLDF